MRSTLRRMAWIRWLPPIDRPSPSPVMTQTCRSGRADLQAGGERRRPAVDGVEAVGVHVVGEAAGAADAETNTIFSRGMPSRRQGLLHLGQDRVVAAAGAPADFLVAGEVLRRVTCSGPSSWTWKNLSEDVMSVNPAIPASSRVRAEARRADATPLADHLTAASLRSSPRSR